MSELTFVLYVDKTSEKYCIVDSYNSANANGVVADANLGTGGRQTAILTGQIASSDLTGLGTVVGEKNTTFDQQGNVYGQWEWVFNMNGLGTDINGKSVPAGALVVNIPLQNNTLIGEPNQIVQIDPASLVPTTLLNGDLYYNKNPSEYVKPTGGVAYVDVNGVVEGSLSTGPYLGATGVVVKRKYTTAPNPVYANIRTYVVSVKLANLTFPNVEEVVLLDRLVNH